MSYKRLHYKLGKEIITEGDTTCQSAYIIECGNVDVWKAGIIDPLKVTKAALYNAASIAIEVLKTEAVVMHIDGPKQASDQEYESMQVEPSKPPIEF